MNSAQAKHIIIPSLIVAGGLTAVADFGQGKYPPLKLAIGVGFLGIILTAGAEVAPQLAGSFGLLILATSLFLYGGPAFGAINRTLKK